MKVVLDNFITLFCLLERVLETEREKMAASTVTVVLGKEGSVNDVEIVTKTWSDARYCHSSLQVSARVYYRL